MVYQIIQTFLDLCQEKGLGLAPTEDGSIIIYEGEKEMVVMFQNSEEGNKLTIEFYETEVSPDEDFKETVLNLFSEAVNSQPIK